MPRIPTPLSEKLINSFEAKEKAYTKADGRGLQLLIKTDGRKLWEFIYTSPTLNKRRKTSFGTYPHTKLAEARKKREEYHKLISEGIDPIEERKNKKEKVKQENKIKENTFEKVAREWLKNYESEVSENYHIKLTRAIELYMIPFIGNKPITDVTRLNLIEILQDLKNRGLKETANRTFMILNKIFMYSTMLEITQHNITADIDKKVILGKIEKKHYPTFTKEKDIKGLLLSIDEYEGEFSTRMALKVLPYLFVRSYNIRHAEWSEIDFNKQEWIIPASKMKTKIEFKLPLPNQVIEIFEEVYKVSGEGKYIFPSFKGNDRPISDNTLISALRRLGYTKEEFVPHSFRSMFSTIAYENFELHNCTSEIIEALLAHKETNKIKDAYNRAQYIEPKKILIQWYADWLDKIKREI